MSKELSHLLEAQRCLEAAEWATNSSQRALFLAMAQIWLNLHEKRKAFGERQRTIQQAIRDANAY